MVDQKSACVILCKLNSIFLKKEKKSQHVIQDLLAVGPGYEYFCFKTLEVILMCNQGG